ncbi:MAG: dienelactone hydrolase family protein [Hydrogenophaga sp.]|uniref:dienelactone hydrolase family protein n=1 Tax=unclassified Hydrogenophaga TaxID=2610897 RepID=UPI001F3289E2|nr:MULTISPECIES: dienelactone hydrolase family protein [unclassified Hydrogenophaga]MDZ4102342.1 dienelactone hydrolase family protein [Hydrogenophaga sp.]
MERKPSRLSSPELRPQDPIDFASEIKVPVLGLYSGIDAFVKQETIAKMRGLMNQGGSGSEIVVFPNVDHGFNADYRPSYDKAAATYAQKLASDWFKKHRV